MDESCICFPHRSNSADISSSRCFSFSHPKAHEEPPVSLTVLIPHLSTQGLLLRPCPKGCSVFDYSFCHLKNLFMIFIVSAEERNASLAETWALFFILNEKDGLPV